jgi:hypothetical protein
MPSRKIVGVGASKHHILMSVRKVPKRLETYLDIEMIKLVSDSTSGGSSLVERPR